MVLTYSVSSSLHPRPSDVLSLGHDGTGSASRGRGSRARKKAKHVRPPVECAEKYGSLASVKMLDGIFTSVEHVMTNNRHCTWLTARFELPDKEYVKRLGLLNFQAGCAPDSTPPPPLSLTPSPAIPATTDSAPADSPSHRMT